MTRRVVVFVDRFAVVSETFVTAEVAALRALGIDVRVESAARPGAPADQASVWEDESTASRARATVWLASRHPLGVLRDVTGRRRWRREEHVVPLRMLAPAARRARPGEHLHAHFATAPALAAMRIARIRGLPWSVTAHAYDIYQRPANLAEKLRAATFATSGCDYTVRDLERIAGRRVEKIVMGVDGEEFRRSAPPASGRVVVAVGRLVEKKGFADLIDAVALMRDAGNAPERVVIAGEGPLAAALAGQASRLGLDQLIELPGALEHDAVRDLLETAAVLCMPCVVATDGDRDSMPVVVKEALAMEVPVVATDEVGLPEVVRPAWGALVAPHDPAALAAALRGELDRPIAERATRGAAGRAFVLAHCDVHAEARKLAALIAG